MTTPLFTGYDPPDERPLPRWVRLTATLGPEGRVLAVEVEAITPKGSVVASRGFYPPPGQHGTLDALRDVLRYGQELVMD